MSRYLHRRIRLAPLLALLLCMAAWAARADEPVVRAVLFYSPYCGHCHKVITEDLPPLFEKYGDQLQIVGIDAAEPDGGALYDAAADKYNIPPESRGVPLLVMADVYLIGSVDIPTQLPVLIEQYLAAGGVDWPDIPGLAEALAQSETAELTATRPPTSSSATVSPTETTPPTLVPTASPTAAQPVPTPTPTPGIILVGGTSDSGFRIRFDRDPIGNGLAVVVLAGMIAAVGWVASQQPWRAWGKGGSASRSWYDWAVPLLSIIGLGVAGYLAYVETQQVRAVCGPVGDCNAVQESEYARLFGLIPVGVLGVLGYLAILATWAIHQLSSSRIGQWARRVMYIMAVGGVVFSIYLTFLEPFIIGATCAWCLSSAVIMTLLLLISTGRMSGRRTWIRNGEAKGEQPAS